MVMYGNFVVDAISREVTDVNMEMPQVPSGNDRLWIGLIQQERPMLVVQVSHDKDSG